MKGKKDNEKIHQKTHTLDPLLGLRVVRDNRCLRERKRNSRFTAWL